MYRILLLVFCLPAFAACAQTQVDTLSLWNYHIEKPAKGQKDKSVGRITFWRAKPIDDSVHMALHQESWTPQISFSIYNLTDSAFCNTQSRKFKMSSSCVGPDVGGDMHQVGNLILLNRDICLSCVAYTSKRDYCRPVINKLLDKMDKPKVKTLSDLEAQVGVKKGDWNNLSK